MFAEDFEGFFDDDDEDEDVEFDEDDDIDKEAEEVTNFFAPAFWTLSNDFEMFLTQCTIQSFTFLLATMKDPETVQWMEEFTEPSIELPKAMLATNDTLGQPAARSKLLNYHGLAAMDTSIFQTWEAYFSQLLERPIETTRIESSSRFIPSYDLEFNPPRLCSRIISVREQIAREFVKDLSVIEQMGGNTMERYWESLREMRKQNATLSDEPVRFARENLMFLDLSCSGQDLHCDPSPLRKGNFDLLVLLATQESIHRVLNDPDRRSVSASPTEQASIYFLQNFYKQRILSHFTGNQKYGRADDFLEELLQEAPRTVQVNVFNKKSGDKEVVTALIDPLSIAEDIMDEREEVARDWGLLAQNVPQTHMQIKRMQFNLLMGIPANATSVTEGIDVDAEYQ